MAFVMNTIHNDLIIKTAEFLNPHDATNLFRTNRRFHNVPQKTASSFLFPLNQRYLARSVKQLISSPEAQFKIWHNITKKILLGPLPTLVGTTSRILAKYYVKLLISLFVCNMLRSDVLSVAFYASTIFGDTIGKTDISRRTVGRYYGFKTMGVAGCASMLSRPFLSMIISNQAVCNVVASIFNGFLLGITGTHAVAIGTCINAAAAIVSRSSKARELISLGVGASAAIYQKINQLLFAR